MSSPITPKVEPGTADTTAGTAEATFTLVDRALVIEHPGGTSVKLHRTRERLEGSPPKERPFGHYFAHSYHDRRDVGPLTLRFQSKEPDSILDDRVAQDSITLALWTRLEEVLGGLECELPEELPRISFDERRHANKSPLGVIDLVFDSITVFQCVRERLKEIDLDMDGRPRRTYFLRRATNSLPSNVFVFDCLNLPLADIDTGKLFSALTSMTEELGSLLGLAKIVVESEDEQYSAHNGTVRGYLELAREWMRVPLKDLAARLPTTFVWYGRGHKLLYAGMDCHAEPKESADYPLSSDEEEDGDDSETPESSDSSDSEDEDGKARKKRKMERE